MLDNVSDRGTGRTTTMLKSIEEDGAIIVVHRARDVYQVQAMIDKHLHANPDRNFIIVAVERETDAYRLRGSTLPIYIDHLFMERADFETRDLVLALQVAAKARL